MSQMDILDMSSTILSLLILVVDGLFVFFVPHFLETTKSSFKCRRVSAAWIAEVWTDQCTV